jgi:exosortase/archaeosortase family protein
LQLHAAVLKPDGSEVSLPIRLVRSLPSISSSALRTFARRHFVLSFVGGVCLLMSGFYGFYLFAWGDVINTWLLPWNLAMHAQIAAAVLKSLGNEISVYSTSLISPQFSMQLVHGCDALEPSALFLSCLIAFPAGFRPKLVGSLVGVLCIETTNIVRIVTLFYVGVYLPDQFDRFHLELWQAAFIVLSVAYWVTWVMWATRTSNRARP